MALFLSQSLSGSEEGALRPPATKSPLCANPLTHEVTAPAGPTHNVQCPLSSTVTKASSYTSREVVTMEAVLQPLCQRHPWSLASLQTPRWRDGSQQKPKMATPLTRWERQNCTNRWNTANEKVGRT